MRRALVALALSASTGCGFGLLDDESGGKDALPAAGAGPFRRPLFDPDTPLEEPWLAADPVLDFDEPAVVARADGGIDVWLGREPADLPVGDTQIWATSLLDLRSAPTPLTLALAADQPWEQGRVSAPAVVVDPADGAHLIMFYEGGLAATAIGRADSFDRGATWQKRAQPVVTDAASPGAATDGVTWLLAVERPGMPGLWLARSTDGVAFATDPAPVVTARAGTAAFDALDVRAPALGWIEQATGRGLWMLWYAGTDEPPPDDDSPRPYAIGYAASFDGVTFARLRGTRAILGAPAGAPSVALGAGGPDYLLFGAPASRRRAVGLATH